MEMGKQKLSLHVELKGENAKKFRTIKQHYGLVRNTEIIKFLISQEYEGLKRRKQQQI
jgi:hypothetical protein